MGLWLVQESRRALWPAGDAPSYEELAALAEAAPAFTAFIDPDDERFLRPGDLPAACGRSARETGQPVPDDTGTLDAGAPREPRAPLRRRRRRARAGLRPAHRGDPRRGRRLEPPAAVPADRRARPGLPVRAGPVEATAIGNLAVQAIAAGELADVAEARELVARSFPVTAYEPEGDWAEARGALRRPGRRAPARTPAAS